MSNQTNELLLERASDMIDYFEGKQPAQRIEKDIDNNDLDQLLIDVSEAEAEASRQEFNNNDIY
jgi:hypothetical protein